MKYSEAEMLDLFTSMVKIDTTNPGRDERPLVDFIGSILDSHGIGYEVVEPMPGRANIVARIGASAGRPVALISHLDVVGCEHQKWTHPPFSATEADGLIYGRGTLDTKYLTAMQLIAFLECADLDLPFPLYFIATADEEQGSTHGMPRVVEAFGEELKYARTINEGGGFFIQNGGEAYYLCTVGEKGRCDVSVAIEGASGPASFKTEGKAVDMFSALVKRMAEYEFPMVKTRTFRRFDEVVGNLFDNRFLEKFAWYNSHDAFILKEYGIGKQVNVLPHSIRFDFSLQLLPGRSFEDAVGILDGIFADMENVSYTIKEFLPGFESSCDSDFYRTMETLAREYYHCEALVPVYALGRTDGRFLGPLPADVYGFSPVTKTIPFEKVLTLVHQVDEHIDRDSVPTGVRFLIELIKRSGS